MDLEPFYCTSWQEDLLLPTIKYRVHNCATSFFLLALAHQQRTPACKTPNNAKPTWLRRFARSAIMHSFGLGLDWGIYCHHYHRVETLKRQNHCPGPTTECSKCGHCNRPSQLTNTNQFTCQAEIRADWVMGTI